MPQDNEKDAKNGEEQAQKKKLGSLKKIIPLAFVAVGIVVVGAAGWFGFQSMAPQAASAQNGSTTLENKVPVVYDLEPFTCNLRPNEFGEMWLYNTTLSLHLEETQSSEMEKALMDEVKSRKDQIRAIVSSTISHRSKEMLRSPEGREALRREIIREINSILVNGEIQDVFFQKALYTMA